MEKEALRQILNQLENFKSEQLLVLIILFFLFLIINIAQAIYTSRKIEKYRNQLKKNEMKFSIFNELQIRQLSILFDLSNNLKSSVVPIYNYLKNSEDTSLKLIEWEKNYLKFNLNYSSNSYIIPKNIKNLILDYNKKSIDFNCNIFLLNEKHSYNSDMLDEDKKECIAIIDKKIDNYNFKKESLKIMLFCEELKVLIEEYFEELK